MKLIGIFYKSEEIAFFLWLLEADYVRRRRLRTDAGIRIHWLDSCQHPPVERNGGMTVLYGLSYPRLKFYNG